MGEEGRTERIITKAIDRMEPAMRRAVIGYYYNNLSVQEIAGAMGMGIPDAYKLVTAGKEFLKNAVWREMGETEHLDDHSYFNTEIFFSCAEEAVAASEAK